MNYCNCHVKSAVEVVLQRAIAGHGREYVAGVLDKRGVNVTGPTPTPPIPHHASIAAIIVAASRRKLPGNTINSILSGLPERITAGSSFCVRLCLCVFVLLGPLRDED